MRGGIQRFKIIKNKRRLFLIKPIMYLHRFLLKVNVLQQKGNEECKKNQKDL